MLIGRRAALDAAVRADRSTNSLGALTRLHARRGGDEHASHERPEEHHPRHRAVGDRADRLAVSSSACRRWRSSSRAQQQQAQQQPQQPPGAPAQQPGPTPQTGAPRAGGAGQPPRRRRAAGQRARPGHDPRGRARRVAARPDRDAARCTARSRSRAARIDDLALTQYRETVDPKSPPIVLLSPSGSPHPFYAEFGWVRGAGRHREAARRRHGVAAGGHRARSRVDQPVTLTYDNGEGLEFRRTIAVDDKYLFTVEDEVVNKGAAPVTLYPYALISRHGTPKIEGYYILHEGLIGVLGDQGLQEVTYSRDRGEEGDQLQGRPTRWLGITDKYWAATLLPDTSAKRAGALLARASSARTKTYQTDYLLDPQTIAPGATGTANARLFAGAKEVADHRRLRQGAQAQPLRAADRLGLVLFHHQAAVPGDRLDLPPGRQFRPRDPDRHRADQDRLLPARQQVLRLDGEDEGGAAGDGGDPRALRRRQDEAAAGADGALQEGEDQSARRLPADPDPDPGVLRALQGAVRHHRDAARAVLRLDQGPLGARPDQRSSTCSG